MITITNVKIYPVSNANSNKILATASITIDDTFVIHGIRILNSEKGAFVSMPQNRMKDGSYKDIAHPIDSETRAYLTKTVLNAYNNQ